MTIKNKRLLVFSLLSIFFFGISFAIIYPGIRAMIEGRQELSQISSQKRKQSTDIQKSEPRTDRSTPSPSKILVDTPIEDKPIIEDVPLRENEKPESEDTSTDVLIETQIDEKVGQVDAAQEKDSEEKQKISPEDQKMLDEGRQL